MLSPMGHENANEDPQVDDHDEEVQEMIDPTPIPENKPRRKIITKIVYDRSPTKTPKKHGGQKPQPRLQANIKNRRRRALQKTNMKKSGSGAHGSKDRNQKTMIISNSWFIN